MQMASSLSVSLPPSHRPSPTTTLSPRSPSSAGSMMQTQAARNPLLLKVNRILSTHYYDDAALRGALDTLGGSELLTSSDENDTVSSTVSRAAGAGVAAGARREGEKPITTKGNGTLGITVGAGGLRKEVERRMAKGSRAFLEAFAEVDEKLQTLQSHLESMKHDCDVVDEQLQKARVGTKYLLEHAQGLRELRSQTRSHQHLLHLFLTRFTLASTEVASLTTASSDIRSSVGKGLFEAMDKVERIRRECAVLLAAAASENENSSFGTVEAVSAAEPDRMRAGLDLISYTTTLLDQGYSKMFKWCAFECRGFEKDAMEVGGVMREVVRRLMEGRPELLEEILATLSTTRSASILSLFLTALTRGGPPPSYLPRPIELHAHDPIRYIGDMLAWVHQALASEREFLDSFFGVEGDGRWVGSVRVFGGQSGGRKGSASAKGKGKEVAEGADGGVATVAAVGGDGKEDKVRRMLDRDLEACGRPLKMRVQQTIKSQEGSLMSYRIATLIHFYRTTMERTIGGDAGMTLVLDEMTEHAYEAFFETLKAQGRSLLRFIQPPSATLSAPPLLRESLATLHEIMLIYASTLLDAPLPTSSSRSTASASAYPISKSFDAHSNLSSDPTSPLFAIEDTGVGTGEGRGISAILDAVLEPAMEMCDRMGRMREKEWERNVFGANCTAAVKSALVLDDPDDDGKGGNGVDGEGAEDVEFLKERRRWVELREEEFAEKLVEEHYSHLLVESGLEPILTAVKFADEATSGSSSPSLSFSSRSIASQSFSQFLRTTSPLPSPRLALLSSSLSARNVHSMALRRICEAYQICLTGLRTIEGTADDGWRSVEEVKMLLGVEEEEQ